MTVDAVKWMADRGFKQVLGLGHVVIDWDTEYQFMREGWDEPQVFSLNTVHPAFNLAGLWYRPLDTSPRP